MVSDTTIDIQKEREQHNTTRSIVVVMLEHSHPGILSHHILPSQKAILSIIQYNFTILPASQLLFSYSTH